MMISEHESTGTASPEAVRSNAGPPPNLRRIGAWVAFVFVLLLIAGIVPRLLRQRELGAAVAEKDVIPSVLVGTAQRAPASVELILPGTVQALRETTIFA